MANMTQLDLFKGKEPPWTPLGPRVLVRRVEGVSKTPAGLTIPASVAAAERPFEGVVLAVGEGVGTAVAVGTVVRYSRFGGVEVDMGDFQPEGKTETLIVLHVDELLLRKR